MPAPCSVRLLRALSPFPQPRSQALLQRRSCSSWVVRQLLQVGATRGTLRACPTRPFPPTSCVRARPCTPCSAPPPPSLVPCAVLLMARAEAADLNLRLLPSQWCLRASQARDLQRPVSQPAPGRAQRASLGSASRHGVPLRASGARVPASLLPPSHAMPWMPSRA